MFIYVGIVAQCYTMSASSSWMRPEVPCESRVPCAGQASKSWMRPPVSELAWMHPSVAARDRSRGKSRSNSPECRVQQQKKRRHVDLTMGMVVLAKAAEPHNSYGRRGQDIGRIEAMLSKPCVNPHTRKPCTTCETGLPTDGVIQFCIFTDCHQRRRRHC